MTTAATPETTEKRDVPIMIRVTRSEMALIESALPASGHSAVATMAYAVLVAHAKRLAQSAPNLTEVEAKAISHAKARKVDIAAALEAALTGKVAQTAGTDAALAAV